MNWSEQALLRIPMALIDVVKCEVNDREFCYKFPSENLRIGTQLVVYTAQTAFFVKGGKICDEFTSGTYTIKTENIPILGKLINLPFGGDTPFKAEVWFINQTVKLDMKWGTPQPLQVEDTRYNVIVPIRAFGQYGFRITNPRLFLETLIGNMSSFTAEKIGLYFKGKIISQLNTLISQKIIKDHISILDINTMLLDISVYCNEELNRSFTQYGVELIDFSVMSINIPQDDPSFIKLKEAKDFAARIKIAGKDGYQMERSFNVLEKAANNEGLGGQMIAMGAGIGVGMGVGSTMGTMASQTINTSPLTPPPLPMTTLYFIAIDSQPQGGFDIQTIKNMIHQGNINADTLIWTHGMSNWCKISQLQEFTNLFNLCPPFLSTNQ